MKKKAELLEADKMKMKEELNGNVCLEAGDTKDEEEEKEEGDSPEIKRIFRPLQSKNQKRSDLKNGNLQNCKFKKKIFIKVIKLNNVKNKKGNKKGQVLK